jgi:ATP-binding cassette subfamily B protein
MANSISRRTLKIYWSHTLRYKRDLWRTAIGVPVAQFADEFIGPLLTAKILTILAVSQRDNTELAFGMFAPYVIGIIAAEIFQMFAWNYVVHGVWRFEEHTMRDLANTNFSHLMSMSQRFFNNRFGGSIVSQVNKFVTSYERLADIMIWNVYKLIIAFVLTVIILVRPAPMYVAVLTLLAIAYVFMVYRVKKGELPYNERWAKLETRRTGQLADSITNIAAVKSFAHEDLEAKLFARRVQDVDDQSLNTMRYVLSNEITTNAIQRLIKISALVVSVWLAINGKVEVGLVYLILTYTMSILMRLWELNNTFRNLNRIFGDARDMTEILGIEPEIKDPARPEKAKITRGRIVFKAVDFRHDDGGANVFENLDLRIKPGEKIGLVGPSGSGKTTLTQLLLRLMDIQKGEISIDGQNISKIKQADLRDRIAYVPQEPMMFHRTIMENIRYGQLDASDEEVIAAAKMANAHEFIEQLSKGYQTLVGERGTKLSGGQRQRVAIARAMLKNAPILVLDEATSALDSESEVLIQDALWKLMKGRTTIVIAHRLSTIQKMDRILVLERGTIIEQGTHRELLHQQGVYAKLWSHQSGGFIET